MSPSAFKVWENCQNNFYHFYLGGNSYVEREVNRAAGIGIIFDAIVKSHLNKVLDINDPRLTTEKLTENIVWAHDVNVDEVFITAGEVAYGYIKHKFYERFLKAKKVLLDREIYHQFKCANNISIPILGILDACIDGVPLDWKLRGFNSKASPTKGYCKRRTSNGEVKKPHPESIYPSNLEAANRDWALQMLFYNWLIEPLDKYPRERLPYIIHEICWTGDDWIFVEHEGTITKSFEIEIIRKLVELWTNISKLECTIEPPTPSTWKCEKYNTLCSTVQSCSEYQRTLGDPEYRMLFT